MNPHIDNASPAIRLFVYGMFKRGERNHDRFCGRAVDVRPATIVGRLYALPAGFPAVVVPEGSILAEGSGDPETDARRQGEFAVQDLAMEEAEGDWDVVHGELITSLDPARDLPPIDRFEGFRPDGSGLYCSGPRFADSVLRCNRSELTAAGGLHRCQGNVAGSAPSSRRRSRWLP